MGTPGGEYIDGGAGNDTMTGGSGDDMIEGGAGVNTATFSGAARNYELSATTGAQAVSVKDKLGTDGDGCSFAHPVRQLRRPDGPTSAVVGEGLQSRPFELHSGVNDL